MKLPFGPNLFATVFGFVLFFVLYVFLLFSKGGSKKNTHVQYWQTSLLTVTVTFPVWMLIKWGSFIGCHL